MYYFVRLSLKGDCNFIGVIGSLSHVLDWCMTQRRLAAVFSNSDKNTSRLGMHRLPRWHISATLVDSRHIHSQNMVFALASVCCSEWVKAYRSTLHVIVALAASAWGPEHIPMQAVCSDTLVSQRVSTTVFARTYLASRRTWIKTKTEVFINLTTGRAVHASLHDRWPCLRCRCSTCIGQVCPTTIVFWLFQYASQIAPIYRFICATWHVLMWSCQALLGRFVLLTALYELSTLLTNLLAVLTTVLQCFMEPLKKVQVEGFLMFAEPQDLFGNLDELCYVSPSQLTAFSDLMTFT